MKKCSWFSIRELIAPEILANLHEQACWTLVSPWVEQLDMIRRLYGGALWLNGNGRKYAGVRPLNCKVGAINSRHKLVVPNVSAWDFVCNDLKKLENVVRNDWQILGAVRMENPEITKTWIHVEFLSELCPAPLKIFDP